MKYRAILFDLDGTLLDTLQDIADAVNKALSRLGFTGHEIESYKYFVGYGRDILAIRVLPESHRDVSTVNKLVSYIDDEYSKCWAENTHPYHGISDLLNRLTTDDIKMAILSNKPHQFAEMMVCRLLSRWRFDIVVGALPSVPKKPDPTAALQIARQLDISPFEFLYLGDSDIDMKTATAASMYPVGALWGFRKADELLANGAEVIIESPSELLRLL
jgi:phosphoglycolate phosphatase